MTELFNEKVFKANSNGTIGSWAITVMDNEDGTATLTSFAAKLVDGKAKETPTIISVGKGKKTVLEQAISEAESKLKIKLRKGYTKEMPLPGERPKNTLGLPIAVKAQKYSKVDHKPPYWVSPKLDGHHMSAGIRDGQVVLYSMNSNEITTLPHIRDELQRLYDEDYWVGSMLDGELYLHGYELDEIKSFSAGNCPQSRLLEFHLYDIKTYNEYEGRWAEVKYITDNSDWMINEVETRQCDTDSEIQELHLEFLKNGYEGTMVRWGTEGYEDSTRSKYLLKLKDYQDTEAKIVGWGLGKPKIGKEKTYQLPYFICAGLKDQTFKVVTSGSHEERNALYEAGMDQHVGKFATYRYFKMNKTGVPSQPTDAKIRDDL